MEIEGETEDRGNGESREICPIMNFRTHPCTYEKTLSVYLALVLYCCV